MCVHDTAFFLTMANREVFVLAYEHGIYPLNTRDQVRTKEVLSTAEKIFSKRATKTKSTTTASGSTVASFPASVP